MPDVCQPASACLCSPPSRLKGSRPKKACGRSYQPQWGLLRRQRINHRLEGRRKRNGARHSRWRESFPRSQCMSERNALNTSSTRPDAKPVAESDMP